MLVQVQAGDAPAGIKQLDVTLMMGSRMRTHMITRSGGADIVPPTSAAFEIDMGEGPINAAIIARDAGGGPLAQGMGSAVVVNGKTVTLTVTLVRSGAIVLDKTTHDFGGLATGGSARTTFRVSNGGTVATGALTVTVTGAGFGAGTDGCSGLALAVGASCNIEVAFAPTAAGAAAGTLMVSGSPGGGAQATLAGTGVTPGTVTIAPASQDFGPVVQNTASPDVTFTVTNPATVATLNLTASLTGGDASQFAIVTDGCSGMTLAPSGTCTVRTRFSPSTTGAKTASLTVGDSNGSGVAALSGTSLDRGNLQIAPMTRDFGSIVMGNMSGTMAFTITNMGGSPTSTLTTMLSDSVNFALASSSCTGTLAGGANCMVMVRFTPTSTGDKLGSVTISAVTGGNAVGSLSGRGLSVAQLELTPPTTNFGAVAMGGQSATVDFTVANSGGGMSGMVMATLSDSTNFTITGTDCAAGGIPAGGTCRVSVRFNPLTVAAHMTTLTVTATPGGSDSAQLTGMGVMPGELRVAPASHAFGSRAMGSSTTATFTVTNMGGTPTGMPVVNLSDGVNYQVMTNGCTAALAVSDSCMITIAFAPTAVGSLAGSLTVSATPGGSTPVSLSGTGTATVTVTTGGLGMGSVASNPSAISCGSTCSAAFASSPVQLTATPADAGSVFSMWTGDCAGQGAVCGLTLNGNKTATALFARAPGPPTTITTPTEGAVRGPNGPLIWTMVPGNTYVCQVDSNAPVSPCTSPIPMIGLMTGAHVARVTATDGFGNPGPPAERNFTVDATAPTVTIQTPTNGGTTGRMPSAIFSSNDAGATYTCVLDTVTLPMCISPQALGTLGGGSHTLAITGTDSLGNSSMTSVTWTVDAVGPTVSITAPVNGGRSSSTLNASWATEAGATYSCMVDTGASAPCSPPHALGPLTAGSHTLRVTGTDQFGNPGATAMSTWTVDMFDGPVIVTVGGMTPLGIAIGDLNNDARLDIATANYDSDNASVLLQGSTPGSFPTSVQYAAANEAESVALGDMNGDGRLDLVVGDEQANMVSVILQNAASPGTFAAPANYATDLVALAVAVGDLNADGRLDIAVANGVGRVSVLLQSSTTVGVFNAFTALTAGSGPCYGVAIGDLNGDGLNDIAVGNSSSNNVSTFRQLAAAPGTFAAATNFPAGMGPTGVAIGDINGDGKLDLAVSNGSSNQVSALMQHATTAGTFLAPVSYAVGTGPRAVVIGDINNDGRLDLAVGNQNSNNVSVLLQSTTAGIFQAALNFDLSGPSYWLAMGDLNGDARLDLASVTGTSVTVVLQNPPSITPTGSFAAAASYNAATGPRAVAAADINRDGRLDLAVANEGSGNISVLLQNPASPGVFLPPANYAAALMAAGVAVGDLNRDGRPDLAVAIASGNSISVLFQDAAGSFGSPVFSAADTNPESIAIGDLNADGRPDLAVAGISSMSVLLQSSSTLGSFLAPANYTGGTNPRSVAIGDLNIDGRLDVVVCNSGSNNVSVFLQGATPGVFTAAVNYNAGSFPRSVALTDVNRDGRLDVVAASHGNTAVVLLANPASPGTFQAQVTYGAGTQPRGIAVGDFNVDGRVDLVLANEASNNVSLFLQAAAPLGTFQAAVQHAAGAGTTAMAVGDFNRDGRPDAAATNNGAGNVSVFLGQ